MAATAPMRAASTRRLVAMPTISMCGAMGSGYKRRVPWPNADPRFAVTYLVNRGVGGCGGAFGTFSPRRWVAY
jgi:hypothetical protein